jgi:hypothetical protein
VKNKAAIGCLTVVVLLGAGGAVGGYAAYRKIRSGFDGFAGLSTVRELDRSVRNHSTYSPPASGELTPAQVEALLRVQAAVRTRLGERIDELQRKYQTYFDKKEATAADLPALVSAYGDLAEALVGGKQAQVETLNAVGFSLAEYRWVRAQAYGALDLRLMDIDIERFIDAARTGRPPAPLEPIAPPSPSGRTANRALVAPHRKPIEDYLVLAFLGL